MDVREKLVELLNSSFAEQYEKRGLLTAQHTATDLIANEVTVQDVPDNNVGKWISVKDRLPEPETDVIAFAGDYIDILSYRYDRRGNLAFMYMDDSGWWHERIRPSVTHWQYLPQPPKGE